MLFERARALREQGEVREALRVADEARAADSAFLPAALLGAGLAKEAGRDSVAQRTVIDAWRHCPHPALGRLFLALHADTSAAEQRKRVETLVANNSDHAESLMLLANQAFDAKQWGTARRHLERAAAECPSAGVYRLLARLEEAETGDGNAVRRRLQQASEAPPDPAWLCTRCASASPAWSIVCDRCGAFDCDRVAHAVTRRGKRLAARYRRRWRRRGGAAASTGGRRHRRRVTVSCGKPASAHDWRLYNAVCLDDSPARNRAAVAQSVEQCIRNAWVGSSNLSCGTSPRIHAFPPIPEIICSARRIETDRRYNSIEAARL